LLVSFHEKSQVKLVLGVCVGTGNEGEVGQAYFLFRNWLVHPTRRIRRNKSHAISLRRSMNGPAVLRERIGPAREAPRARRVGDQYGEA
jgi:hypothetical protein